MSHDDATPMRVRWARLRFSIIGPLLAAPPAPGELSERLRELCQKSYQHPTTKLGIRFGASTIERWYYRARREQDDPVGVLRRAVRKDCGQVSLPAAVAERLRRQYHEHPHWTYQLHFDNLLALLQAEPTLGPLRSYATVRRYLQAHGLVRAARRTDPCAGVGAHL